eukprot:gene8552-17638_t
MSSTNTHLQYVVEHPAFEGAIYFVIILNCIFLATAEPTQSIPLYYKIGYWIFDDSWNWIDALVVAFSVYQIIAKALINEGYHPLSTSYFETLAALRLFRLMRMLFHIPSVRRLTNSIVRSSWDLLCAASLIFSVLIAWAFIAHEVLGDKLNYRCIPNTLSTLKDVSAYYYNVYGTTDFRPIYNENICGYGPHTCDTVIINNVSSVCTDLSDIFTSSSTPSYWSYSTPYSAFVTTFILLTMRGWMDLFDIMSRADGFVVSYIFVFGPPLLFTVFLVSFFPAVLFMSLKVGEDLLRRKEWLTSVTATSSPENVTEFQLMILAFSNMLSLKKQQMLEHKRNRDVEGEISVDVYCVPRCHACDKLREIVFAEDGIFNYCVNVLILLDVALLASSSSEMSDGYRRTVTVLNLAIGALFLCELVVAMSLLGPVEYFRVPKRSLEFVVIVLAFAGNVWGKFQFLMCARLLRFLYMTRWHLVIGLRDIAHTSRWKTVLGVNDYKKILFKMLPTLGLYILLMVLLQVIFTLLGMQYFGKFDFSGVDVSDLYRTTMEHSNLKLERFRFGNFGEAWVSVFLIFTLDAWYFSMWTEMDTTGRFSALFFMFWICVSNWILQAFLVASTMLIMDNHAHDCIIDASLIYEMVCKKFFVIRERLLLKQYFAIFKRNTFDPTMLRLKLGVTNVPMNNEVKEVVEDPPKPHWTIQVVRRMDRNPMCIVVAGSPFQKFCEWLPKNKRYVIVVNVAICLSVVVTIVQGGYTTHSLSSHVADTINVILTVLFLFDMGLKWCGVGWFLYPRGYFYSFFNWVDFVCNALLVTGWVTSSPSYNAIRVVRFFRVPKILLLCRDTPVVQELVHSVTGSLRSLFTLLILSIMGMFLYAIIGLHSFDGSFGHCSDSEYPPRRDRYFSDTAYPDGCSGSAPDPHWEQPRERFDNIGKAFQSVFRVMMFNEWHPILFSAMDSVGADKQPERYFSSASVLYFTLIVLTSVVLNSLVVGVVYYHFKLSTLWGGRTVIRTVQEAMWMLYEEQLNTIHLVDKTVAMKELGRFQRLYRRLMKTLTYKSICTGLTLMPVLFWHLSDNRTYLQASGLVVGTIALNCIYIVDYILRQSMAQFRYRSKLMLLELLCAIGLIIVVIVLASAGLDVTVQAVHLAELSTVLRLSRFLESFQAFNHMLETMYTSMTGIFPLLCVSLTVAVIYTVIGVNLLGFIDPKKFPDLLSCWLALMKLSTGNGWSGE